MYSTILLLRGGGVDSVCVLSREEASRVSERQAWVCSETEQAASVDTEKLEDTEHRCLALCY